VRRRDFITLLGGAAATWPLVARAQQPAPVIGFLNILSADQDQGRARAFRQGLAEAGFVDGRDVTIDYRWAGGQPKLVAVSADELVRRQVSVIAAGSDTAALAAKAATNTIPIVFAGGNDPVRLGLVDSLRRPGGNVTGFVNLNIELEPKRIQLLHELVPSARAIALLVNPRNPSADTIERGLQTAARAFGLEPQILHASTEREIDAVFASLTDRALGALVVGADVFLISRSEQLATLALRHALPAISRAREFAVAGGLASYGTDIKDQYRLVGLYTARVLKGEKPADLPVQQATKLELVINLRTANAFGLTVPLSLLARADEVIE
jgi:putative tryptophan/tyrosine transport system substrate-binding protein